MLMLWVKSLHVIFMVAWFAGLFYLPRLFVYHAMSKDQISTDRFKIMERKLYYGIMAPGASLTILSGLWLLNFDWDFYKASASFHAKLALVLILVIYHLYCGHLRKKLQRDADTHSHVFYRWLNEIPTLILIGCVILVIVKPL